MPVETSDTVSRQIEVLHDTYMLSFREIASTPAYDPIPHSTIADIYHGGRVPNKWRYKFNMPKLIKVRADRVKKHPPQPPRNLTRCTFYPGTATAKIIRDLKRVTGKTFVLDNTDNVPIIQKGRTK